MANPRAICLQSRRFANARDDGHRFSSLGGCDGFPMPPAVGPVLPPLRPSGVPCAGTLSGRMDGGGFSARGSLPGLFPSLLSQDVTASSIGRMIVGSLDMAFIDRRTSRS